MPVARPPPPTPVIRQYAYAPSKETVRHESVHALLGSPPRSFFAGPRADFAWWAHRHSQLLRFAEEVLAETHATGSLRHGVGLALEAGDQISKRRLALSALGYSATVATPIWLGASQ